MTLRRATTADLPAIRATLSASVERAMFPLSNLDRFGFEGEANYAPFFWVNGDVTDVLCVTRSGMVMPFLPSGDLAAAHEVLSGREIIGVIGAADWSRPLADRLGLTPGNTSLNQDEAHYNLTLTDLAVPDGDGHLIPLQDMDQGIFVEWRKIYHMEALEEPEERAAVGAETDIDRYREADSHRALVIDGTPVAMTGFNAQLPQIVQIGGVFTPPDLRRRGYARRAVGLHLLEARARGVTHATLFAGNPNAIRAYEALGFARIGMWTLILTNEPHRV